MKWKLKSLLITVSFLIFQGCSSLKIVDSWHSDERDIKNFKKKNVLVIARTANDHARIAFEEEIAMQLRAKGIKATESFKKIPKIYPNKEVNEERIALIKSLLESEGFTGIVLTVIRDKEQTTRISRNSIYISATYNNYYPGYYGGFYDYYASPYAYGSYYDSFGGYIPTTTRTQTTTNYVLETVAYNLDEPSESQLVSIVTSHIKDPKEAYKTAEKYAKQIMKSIK